MILERVIILFGGPGSEHRVSVASGQNVVAHLPNAECWFWSRGGQIFLVKRSELLEHINPFQVDFCPRKEPDWPSLESAIADPIAKSKVFFLALHGDIGEDGTVQGWFEKNELLFTGSGSSSSALAFHKEKAKTAVAKKGIRIASSHLVSGADLSYAKHLFEEAQKKEEHLVLKPLKDGSSNGLFIIKAEKDQRAALDWLKAHAKMPHMVEPFISGIELTVGVLQKEDGLWPLPCTEVRLEPGRTFDFAGKYLGQGTQEITPAEIPTSWAESVKSMALTAHHTLDCFGYSRTDIIYGAEGPIFIEINTLPGLTQASFIPQQLVADGQNMEDFVRAQIFLARSRPKLR